MACWEQTYRQNNRKPFLVDQPLDFSVKSPGSYGGSERDLCSPSQDHNSTTRSSKSRSSNGIQVKDEQYWLRREKNNAAAKRSRDARRQKEEITKQENLKLREENERLRFTVNTLKEHINVCPHSRGTALNDFN